MVVIGFCNIWYEWNNLCVFVLLLCYVCFVVWKEICLEEIVYLVLINLVYGWIVLFDCRIFLLWVVYLWNLV